MRTNRRRFLAAIGTTVSAMLTGPALFDFKLFAGTPWVRRDVGGLSSTDPIILSYQNGIAAMQALPSSDPRSWSYQAAIHGTDATPVMTGWNQCQHGTHWFWAWHRMYLYWFERIVRKMAGDPSWALPYWNWTAETQLPSMFRITTSNLYTPLRDPNINAGTGSLPAFDVDYSFSFAELDYYLAQSELEGSPHGVVHTDVGGYPGGSPGWMSRVPTAAQDPIFYLHHANIDRLWDLWLAQHGGRTDPLNDSTWEGQVFTFFDENGAQVQMTPCDVLNAATQLNYTYEGEPPQVVESCGASPPWRFSQVILYRFPWPPDPIDGDPYTVQVDLSSVFSKLQKILQNPANSVYLQLSGVAADTSPGAAWEVYVGLPAGVPPSPTSPYFVGKMALFGAGVRSDTHTGHQFHPAVLKFNIEKAITLATQTGAATIPITFIAAGILVNGQPVPPRVHSPVTVANGEIIIVTKARR